MVQTHFDAYFYRNSISQRNVPSENEKGYPRKHEKQGVQRLNEDHLVIKQKT